MFLFVSIVTSAVLCLPYSLQHHLLFTYLSVSLLFKLRNVLFLGQSELSRSALPCRPLWTLAPPLSQGLGWDLKLHQTCRHPVPNLSKSPSLWNWISWLSCTVPASLVSDHKVVLVCYTKKLEGKTNSMYFRMHKFLR